MSVKHRFTTDQYDYPPELSPAGRFPPPPDPPPNSHNFLSRMSPSPITVPPVLSPSPITKSKKQKVQFQPNLSYNKEVDIHWYNDSPITKSQYNWLVDRHKKGLEFPETFPYPPKILYKEEFDGTCWFKGYKISCETYDGLNEEQNANTKKLAKSHKKPGLYRDPLERFTLLWLREIGEGEAAVNKNKQIERDWKLVKEGPITVYRNATINPGKPGDVLNDMHRINGHYKQTEIYENTREITAILDRYYNKDEYKTQDNNVYKEVTDAIDILKSPTSIINDKLKASNYLKYMQDKMNEETDWVIGGKKRKQTRKRKKSKRKTNRKRKTNTRGKSRKK